MKYIATLLALTILAACGGPDNSPEGKKKQLAELKTQAAELQKQIAQLETEVGGNKAAAKPEAAKLVETAALAPEDFAHYIEVQGNVSSDENVMVAPEINGLIVRRLVKEGQPVRAGQVIAEIDAENIRRSISELETRLELATLTFQKQENLWKQQIGTEIQYLQAKNAKEALEKNIASIKSQLNKAYVKAPIGGTLEQFMQNVGEMGNPAMPLARIVNNRLVKVEAEVSETYTKAIRRGDAVLVSFPAVGQEMNLRVESTGDFINPNNRTFRLLMRASNPNDLLKPNSLAVVKIRDYFKKGAVVLPTNLIQQSATGQDFVYVRRQKNGKNVAERVDVTTGQSYQGKTVIETGLQAGDEVITKGYNEVANGVEIQLANPAKS